MCYAASIILTRNIIRMDMLSLDSDGRDDLEDESSIWENPSRIVVGETPINFTYPTQYLISEIRFDNKDTQDGRGREYYGDQHSGEYLLCTWKDGMKNGDGILYNKYGEVIFRGMFVNDYIEGDGYIFKDGVIVAKCRFTRSQMNSFCYIECTPKHVIMVEKSSRGYYRYRGGFNEATNGREGYGAEYGEDGRLSHYGVYESNVLIQKNKLFKGNIMQELDEEEHTVYIGHYKDDLDTGFPREGEGREYQDGILLFKGTYLNGERNGPGTIYHKHGIAKIKGVWKNGELIEQHEIDDAGYYKDLTFDGRSDSFVQFVGGMGTFSLHVKHVKLANGMCNKENLTRLQFTNINQLRTIDIGSNCFRYVQTVTISNLNSLQSIEIGDDSFTLFNRTTNLPSDPSNEAYTLKDKCICCISDCKQLEIIRMGPGSFSSFSSFSVTNLPSLKTLAIGKLYTETVPSEKCSYCFFWASRFVLSDLHSLFSVAIGNHCFHDVNMVVVDNCASLNSFICGASSLCGSWKKEGNSYSVTFNLLPQLTFFILGEYVMYYCEYICFSYFPLILKKEQFILMNETLHSVKTIQYDGKNSKVFKSILSGFMSAKQIKD